MNETTTTPPSAPDLHEPILPDAEMSIVKPKTPVVGRVVSNESCMKGKSASFVRHTVIDIGGTPLEGKCLAGQSFGVIPPGEDATGKPHSVRLYSLANGSRGEGGKPHLISTTPKRLIDEYWPQKSDDPAPKGTLFLGVCSNYLCDLQPGDEVHVSGPNGKRFLLPIEPDKHHYIFLATGTGIAPFRGFVQDLFVDCDTPCTSEIHLIMGSPYKTDLLYDDLFRSLAENHENFHYHTAISREAFEGSDAGGRGLYTHDYIDRHMSTFGPLLADPRTLIYMCGLIGMQFGIYKLLAKHKLDAGYQVVRDELEEIDFADWRPDQMKRSIRPTHRMMVEVY